MTENRCERCNRVLSDPDARYGWRCAEILGVSDNLNYAGDEVFKAFSLGGKAADEFTRGKNLSESQKQTVYEAMIKRYISADMHNSDLWRSANRESFSGEREPNSKSLAEYMDLRDEYDYGNRAYSTTRYLENAPTDETRKLQHALNKIGIRDRFGNKLIEDGLNGPKTQWANDALIKGNSHALNYNKEAFLSNGKFYVGEKKYKDPAIANHLGQLFEKETRKPVFRVDYGKVPDYETPQYHINVKNLDDALPHQKKLASALNHKIISESTYSFFKDFDNLEKLSKKGGKALSVVGYVFDAYEFGTAVYADLNDEDKRIGRTTVNSAAGIGGSWAGGAAGAKLGAMGGAAIGSFILPGLGTAIGGFVGGAIGGMAGSYAGRELGEHIIDEGYAFKEEYDEREKAY